MQWHVLAPAGLFLYTVLFWCSGSEICRFVFVPATQPLNCFAFSAVSVLEKPNTSSSGCMKTRAADWPESQRKAVIYWKGRSSLNLQKRAYIET